MSVGIGLVLPSSGFALARGYGKPYRYIQHHAGTSCFDNQADWVYKVVWPKIISRTESQGLSWSWTGPYDCASRSAVQ